MRNILEIWFLKWYVNLIFRESWYKSFSTSSIFCGGVGLKDSPSCKTLISLLLRGTLDKFNTFVEVGSKVCDAGPVIFSACICCWLLRFHHEIVYRHILSKSSLLFDSSSFSYDAFNLSKRSFHLSVFLFSSSFNFCLYFTWSYCCCLLSKFSESTIFCYVRQ